ncbi:MAG: GIY-YIG nuclease family protein [Candidatus Moranbacteria bacterium]|nr:GIY-YIG nuclease family protein [Candidatus Moranbacteria bacterium]
MYYVYILRSKSQPGAIYKGYSGNLKKRIEQHNNGNNKGYSKVYSPWEIEIYLGFKSKEKAKNFEKYLKSSSGNAFMSKHLLSEDFKRALTKFKEKRRGKRSLRSEAK